MTTVAGTKPRRPIGPWLQLPECLCPHGFAGCESEEHLFFVGRDLGQQRPQFTVVACLVSRPGGDGEAGLP